MSLTGWERMPPGPTKREALEDEIPQLNKAAEGAAWRFMLLLLVPCSAFMFWRASTSHSWHGTAAMIVSVLLCPAYLGACWYVRRVSRKRWDD